MFENYYNIISSKPFIIVILVLIVIIVVLTIVVSYFFVRFLKYSIDDSGIFFYRYNKKCQKILEEYGDCKINNVYLVRQPFGKFINFIFNILTLFKYSKYLSESVDNYPYHPALIFEITQNDNIKFLLVEKNNCINICETFLINKIYDLKKVSFKKNKFTLNKILKTTQKRIGNNKFFNWNLSKNNCQEFTKEILITLNKNMEKYEDFIFSDKIIKKYFTEPSDFTLHIINCLFIIINFIEKYLLDNNIFY